MGADKYDGDGQPTAETTPTATEPAATATETTPTPAEPAVETPNAPTA